MKIFLFDRTSLSDIGQLSVPVEKGVVIVSMRLALDSPSIATKSLVLTGVLVITLNIILPSSRSNGVVLKKL